MGKGPTVEDLRKQCKAAGLQTKGNKAQLTKRLEEWSESRESSAESADHPKCDAILGAVAKVSSDVQTIMDAKVSLGQALEKGQLEVERVHGVAIVGNRRGLDLGDLKLRVSITEHLIASQNDRIASQSDRISSLEKELGVVNDRLSTLTLALREYRQVRERFISTYRRDKLHDATARDFKIIQEGNVVAHGGDAAADALLHDGPDRRTDTMVYRRLYGMHPSDVRLIRHKQTLDILSIHAGVVADDKKTGTEEFYEKFKVFIERFDNSNHNVNYLNVEPGTDVTSAYWQLLHCQIYKNIS
ncbi:unnamed protein product, partial [Tuber aestivum]